MWVLKLDFYKECPLGWIMYDIHKWSINWNMLHSIRILHCPISQCPHKLKPQKKHSLESSAWLAFWMCGTSCAGCRRQVCHMRKHHMMYPVCFVLFSSSCSCQCVKLQRKVQLVHTCWYIVSEHLGLLWLRASGHTDAQFTFWAFSCQDTAQHSNQCISSAPIPSTLGRWHSRAASNFSQWWMGWWGRGRDDELQSGGSSGTVINGLLPETSAVRLSIIGRPEKPSEGMMVSAVRSLAVGGHATPFEVFITIFCHYMIKVIAGRVGAFWQGQYSPPVINQWFPLMIRECVDGFLCKCLRYTVQPGLSDLCGVWRLFPGSKYSQ